MVNLMVTVRLENHIEGNPLTHLEQDHSIRQKVAMGLQRKGQFPRWKKIKR